MIRTRRAIANTRKTSRPMHEAPDTPPNDQAEFGPMEDRVYDAYQDHRNRLLDGEQKLGESYDQYLLTLSGGAIGLSLAFLHDLVTPGAVRFAWMLATAWTLLVVTIFLVGAMMRVSQVGHERFRDSRSNQAGAATTATAEASEMSLCWRCLVRVDDPSTYVRYVRADMATAAGRGRRYIQPPVSGCEMTRRAAIDVVTPQHRRWPDCPVNAPRMSFDVTSTAILRACPRPGSSSSGARCSVAFFRGEACGDSLHKLVGSRLASPSVAPDTTPSLQDGVPR